MTARSPRLDPRPGDRIPTAAGTYEVLDRLGDDGAPAEGGGVVAYRLVLPSGAASRRVVVSVLRWAALLPEEQA